MPKVCIVSVETEYVENDDYYKSVQRILDASSWTEVTVSEENALRQWAWDHNLKTSHRSKKYHVLTLEEPEELMQDVKKFAAEQKAKQDAAEAKRAARKAKAKKTREEKEKRDAKQKAAEEKELFEALKAKLEGGATSVEKDTKKGR